MKWSVTAGAVAVGATLLGCDPVIVDMSPEQPLLSGPSVASTGASGGGSGAPNALAWKGSDTEGFVDAPDALPDADALVLWLSRSTQTECGVTTITDPDPCDDASQLVLFIPPELNRPGPVALDDPRVVFQWAVHAQCAGSSSGGGPYGGLLEITSSDASSVSVTLTGALDPIFDGEFVATRCGTPPPPFTPTAAVAVPGTSIAGDPSSGTGTPAQPDALYVFLGSTPGTCGEPHPAIACNADSQMVLSLPPALQGPGEVALNDPQIGAVFTSFWNSCEPTAPEAGTMTILQASATSLLVRVLGSGLAALDGDYDVAICP